MQDISSALNKIMHDTDCTSTCAALLLLATSEVEESDGLHKLQSEPLKEIGGGLCGAGNCKGN